MWDTDFAPCAQLTPSVAGPVLCGLGSSSAAKADEAAREALASAFEALAAATGRAPKPSLAIVACSKAVADAEEARCELVRAMPDALLHGAASMATLFASQSPSSSRSAPSDAVGCLLLEAPDGSFAAAWDDTGDALYAAKWLQEQMPDAQAVIMSAAPGHEESAAQAVELVFPGVPVYGRSAVQAAHWVTMSHLGSSENGVSLVGIGAKVGFGAADAAPRSEQDFSSSLVEVYDAAMVAGCLKNATAGIITCRGQLSDFSFADPLRQKVAGMPLLGAVCDNHAQLQQHGPSIGIMLFGERQPQQGFANGMLSKVCSSEEESTSGSTAWPGSPATDISTNEGSVASPCRSIGTAIEQAGHDFSPESVIHEL